MITLQDSVRVEDPYGDFCRAERESYSYQAMRDKEERIDEHND